jgi:hypothetical protein
LSELVRIQMDETDQEVSGRKPSVNVMTISAD